MPSSVLVNNTATLKAIQDAHPEIRFVCGTRFAWRSNENEIIYKPIRDDDSKWLWALLHEIGHALLKHLDFTTDIGLLKIEAQAWHKATLLAKNYNTVISQDYIDRCLDSYRDWLHIRATCPSCYERCLQSDSRTYACHNCDESWRVTRSRLCRPYRMRG